MIELRQLSYFAAACHQTSFSKTAEVLGIALSTLSTSLENLEKEIGAQLFRRVPSGLTPTIAGRWLYRAAVPILQAEAFTRQAARSDGENLLPPLVVELHLMFSLGNLSKAVSAALASLQTDHPDMFIEPHWHSFDGEPPLPLNGLPASGRIIFSYGNEGDVIHADSWVLARRFPVETDATPSMDAFLSGPIVVPSLPNPLMKDLATYLAAHPLPKVKLVADHPGTLARLTGESPDTAFLLPSSILAHRMGLQQVRSAPLDPPLVSHIRCHIAEPHPLATKVIERILGHFFAGDMPAPFKPMLTRRQFSYFELIDNNRNLTAAARTAKVAQPAITGQLRKMEQTIGKPLFERRRDGLVPTAAGQAFRIGSNLVNARLQSMAIHSIGAAGRNRSRLRMGVLPSAGQESTLLTRMTDAILTWQDRNPHIDLQILEAPTAVLQDWVQNGTINLAVLETDLPNMARFSLQMTEPLALICNPEFEAEFDSGTAVELEQLVALPLILPTNAFGIRQLLDARLSARHLQLEPVMEINSMPMLIAMLKRKQFCTVLPVSAVGRDIAQGTLASRPLSPEIRRKLFVIYSNARELTAVERELVGNMKTALSAS